MAKRQLTLVDVEREIGLRGSFHDFVRMAWSTVETGDFLDNWHIPLVCTHLEALRDGRIRRLIINVPPGCMKSLLVSVFWPAWCWLRNPQYRTIYASYDPNLTLRDARRKIALIKSRWFQERWGDKFKLTNELAGSDFHNDHKGWRYSTSIKGPMTGRHCDCMGIDDPIKPQEATKVNLTYCREWWGGTAATRFRVPTKSGKVIIMQRLHEDDLVGHVLRKEKNENWVHLRLPMRYESAFPCETAFGKDPRTEDGELLWPARFPDDELTKIETVLGPMATAAQMQQRPVPEGGAIFKREWIRYYEKVPATLDEIIQSWDCTFKGLAKSDYVVGQVWGRLGGAYYLLDQVRAQMGFEATLEEIRALSRKWPKCRSILIEDKANGSACIETLSKEMSRIVPVDPQGGKASRANAVTGLHKAGNVFYPRPEDAPWVDHHVQEMLTFPAGANDDTVDAETQALTHLEQAASYFSAAMARLALDSSGNLI